MEEQDQQCSKAPAAARQHGGAGDGAENSAGKRKSTLHLLKFKSAADHVLMSQVCKIPHLDM
jgi:hypothetical protein